MIIKQDPEYKKLARIFSALRKRTNFEKEHQEVLKLHGSRKSINLITSKDRFDPRAVFEAVQMDMAYRGRLVTMLKNHKHSLIMLDESLRMFRTYALVEYRDDLGSTRDQRTLVLDQICGKALDFIAKVEAHIEDIEMVVKDIDQANFQFRHLVDLLEILEARGNRNI